jgi:replication factor A1
MTAQDIIQEILSKDPTISQEQILQSLESEKARTNGLLGDETLLRLIAAKFGVEVQQNAMHNSGILSSKHLFSGLHDVSVAGRLIAVFPAKTFQGAEKSGKFATLMLADMDGIVRIVLWNEKADLVELGTFKTGQTVRLLHGYTRSDRYGKTELHVGTKSKIQVDPEAKTQDWPSLEKFATKTSLLTSALGNVHLVGKIKSVLSKNKFSKNDGEEGLVLRFKLEDDLGEATVVVWNKKVCEFEKAQTPQAKIALVNARVKESKNGDLEVHVDSNAYLDFLVDN